jgi:DNA-binding MarR family transcriptional regulator
MDEKTISKIEESLGLMMQAFRQAFRKSDVSFDHTLSRSQREVVMLIHEQQSVSIKDIATHLELTSSAATQLVDALVEKDILSRKEKPADRRVVEVTFADTFASHMANLKKNKTQIISELFIDVTQEEIETISRVAEKISKRTNHQKL